MHVMKYQSRVVSHAGKSKQNSCNHNVSFCNGRIIRELSPYQGNEGDCHRVIGLLEKIQR